MTLCPGHRAECVSHFILLVTSARDIFFFLNLHGTLGRVVRSREWKLHVQGCTGNTRHTTFAKTWLVTFHVSVCHLGVALVFYTDDSQLPAPSEVDPAFSSL